MEGDHAEALDTQNVWAFVVIGVLGVTVIGLIVHGAVKGSSHGGSSKSAYCIGEKTGLIRKSRFTSNIAF